VFLALNGPNQSLMLQ